jgi:DNA-binding NarL/FixJ family response regulator
VAGIRTVIVTTPAMLGDLVKRLALGRVELEVVAELGTRRALARRLPELRPDLVVIGLHRRESDGIVTTLLMQLPKAKFIVFSADARTVIGYELRLHKAALSELSPDGFIGFMRPDGAHIA